MISGSFSMHRIFLSCAVSVFSLLLEKTTLQRENKIVAGELRGGRGEGGEREGRGREGGEREKERRREGGREREIIDGKKHVRY